MIAVIIANKELQGVEKRLASLTFDGNVTWLNVNMTLDDSLDGVDVVYTLEKHKDKIPSGAYKVIFLDGKTDVKTEEKEEAVQEVKRTRARKPRA